MSLFSLIATVLASLTITVVVISGHPGPSSSVSAFPRDGVSLKRALGLQQLRRELPERDHLSSPLRSKRTVEHHITDCIHMTSEEGDFYHKATIVDGNACGAYIFGEPDQIIEIRFNYLDVPCENGGLVAVMDGWELNGEYFPSPRDHPKPLSARFNEFCGQRKVKQAFISSQNVALIQYRMPARGSSFSFSVRFLKNPNPCNVLFQTNDIYTLRNYGKRANCSVSTLFPAAINVASLNIGVTPSNGRGIEFETGTIHKCQKRGLDDYVQIGGSPGLDNGNMQVADSLCGLDSKAGKRVEKIACDTTTVRLVSSGAFDNSVTIYFRQLTEDDISGYMNVVCLTEDMIEK
ncbi:corticotropin-releasing factor-binding protein isoform X2 [Anoplophora glabripennis]|uniref:corticotropin-releasing factor-binding protein isoform X2 n=1 Tax=Anoplophora glabripennis TaxID=217634 RepID=UPI000C76D0D6|nr:corticotropin-releasing factor-binding protein isoform X2 [Anoplophora glabripennis]